MPMDPATLDTIARCLRYLTRLSGLDAADCLSTLEEFSQPLGPDARAQILVWFDHFDRTPSSFH